MGTFDDVAQDLAVAITAIFVNTPSVFQRVVNDFNPKTRKDVALIESEAEILISPPLPYDIKIINGTSVLSQDLQCFAPAKSLEEKNFDPIPTTKTDVYVTTRGRTYKVMSAGIISGGDTVALYEIQLRP